MYNFGRKGRKNKIIFSILVVSIMMIPLLSENEVKANIEIREINEINIESDPGWVKHFPGTSWGSSVIQTSKGEYVIAGGIGYYDDCDALMIKTDAEGNPLWEITFGDSSGWDAFWGGLLETDDGGFVASGTKNVTSYLVKVDADGNTIWERLYGEPTMGSILDVQQTSDGGFILTGRVYHEPRRGWLIKTDSEGKEIWNKTLGGEYPTTLWTIRITEDGEYIMGGFERNPEKLWDYSYAVKTDAAGNVVWENSYESCGGFTHGVVETQDGGFIFAGGQPILSRLNILQISLIRTDEDGNEILCSYYGCPIFSDNPHWIENTSDGGYIVSGYTLGLGTVINFLKTGDFVPLWSKIWLQKFDVDGNSEWDKKNYGTGIGRCVRQISDGYIMTGHKGAFNDPKGIILIKTDENGSID